MRRRRALCAGAALLALAGPSAAEELAIVHAQAWTGQGSAPLEDATIVVDQGRISRVAAHAAPPPGARVIDARGRRVTAGLVNAATQLGLTEISAVAATRDQAASGEALGPAFDVSLALNPNSAIVALARADGLTRALSFPDPSGLAPFGGLAATIRLRPGPDILDRPRAALFVSIGGNTGRGGPGSRAAQWQLLRAALDDARQSAAPAGRGSLKEAQAGALKDVLSGRIALAVVTHRESDIRQAIALAHDYAVRMVIVGGAEAWRAAPDLARAHIPVVLDPEANLPASFDELGSRQTNAAILAGAGVEIAFGLAGGRLEQTYNAGLALREGAGVAVANGLPYEAALRAVTVNSLHIWRPDAAAGLIAPGQEADLVIWDGDPFEPATNAEVVIVEGAVAPVETRMDALARRYRDPGGAGP